MVSSTTEYTLALAKHVYLAGRWRRVGWTTILGTCNLKLGTVAQALACMALLQRPKEVQLELHRSLMVRGDDDDDDMVSKKLIHTPSPEKTLKPPPPSTTNKERPNSSPSLSNGFDNDADERGRWCGQSLTSQIWRPSGLVFAFR